MMDHRVRFFHKCFLGLLAGLLSAHLLVLISQWSPALVPNGIFQTTSMIVAAACFIAVPVWHYKERKNVAATAPVLAFFQGLVIYCIAFVFFMFGMLKLLGLHMHPSLVFSDLPAGRLTGYFLMDYFFARAPGFKILIGCLQLAGSACMLFRKTRFVGIFILLPLVINIVLMDLFYEIGFHVTLLAFNLSLGLLYLLWVDRKKVSLFLFNVAGNVQLYLFRRALVKNGLRFSAIIVPLCILIPAHKPAKNKELAGKYKVIEFRLGQNNVPIDLNQDSVLSTVYFDENDDCVFRYNDFKKLKIGAALYDAKSQWLDVTWRYPKTAHDALHVGLYRPATDAIRLVGTMGADSIRLTLRKVSLPSPEES